MTAPNMNGMEEQYERDKPFSTGRVISHDRSKQSQHEENKKELNIWTNSARGTWRMSHCP